MLNMEWNEFLEILKEHEVVRVTEVQEDTGYVRIEVPHTIPMEIDEIIRQNDILVQKKSRRVFEVNAGDLQRS